MFKSGIRPGRTECHKVTCSKLLKRGDFIKIGDILVFGAVAALTIFLISRVFAGDVSAVRLKITAPSFEEHYSLDQRKLLKVPGPLGNTTIVIQDGQAWIQDSPCREKICIKMGKIKRPGEQAVCLPNRVIIEIEGNRKSVDAVTR